MNWIDAKVAIPAKPGKYIVYELLNNKVNHDYWNVSDSFRPFWNHYDNNVTHWMPLPEPPLAD